MRSTRFALFVCLAVAVPLQSTRCSAAGNSDADDTVATDHESGLNRVNLLSGLGLGPLEDDVKEAGDVEEASWVNLGPTRRSGSRNCRGDHWQLMPRGLVYRPYLASSKESRIRGVWHEDKNEGNIWDISLGGQVGILRYGSSGNGRPTGWQLGMEGAGLVRLDWDENNDVMATDYRFGVPLTWGDEVVQYKVGYYHLSSHLGDEFLLKNPGYPRLNFSRDVLIFGTSLSPREKWRVYSELGYAFRADVTEEWEVQFGIEYAPEGATGIHGEPFAAVNGHLREEVDFGGNFVGQLGWAWRGSPASGMFRMGVEYFNGKNEQFSFFDVSEQKVGFGMWYDY